MEIDDFKSFERFVTYTLLTISIVFAVVVVFFLI